MLKTGFYVNTAIVCYNCRRAAVVRSMQSWRNVFPVGQETEVLDIVFVSCAICLTLPHVHNPLVSRFRSHVDPQKYSNPIRSLMHIFGYTPLILDEVIFWIKAFRIKDLVQIRDVSEVFNMSTIPEENVMILENGREIRSNYRFFRYDSYFITRGQRRYPSVDSKEGDDSPMPFATIANRPPAQVTVLEDVVKLLKAPLCAGYLSALDKDIPLSYKE